MACEINRTDKQSGGQEDHVNLQVMAELDAIADMVKRAESKSLLVEVVASFGNLRASGGGAIASACRCASDWNI